MTSVPDLNGNRVDPTLPIQPPGEGVTVAIRDQHQSFGEPKSSVFLRWNRCCSGMGMSHAKHLQASDTGPALSRQLFHRINGEAGRPFHGRPPDVAGGPDRIHQPTRLHWDRTKQQSASFIRGTGSEAVIKNREALMIQAQQRWHKRHLADTLCRPCK